MADEIRPNRHRLEIPRPKNEIAAFGEAIIGQDEAVESFARLLVSLKSGIRPIKPSPLDVKFLAGPSGVGKTEIVYRLAELLGGPSSRNKVIKLNGGEYKSKAEVARLIGSPPGYIGSEDPRYPGGTKPLLGQENLSTHKISFKDRNGQDRDVVIILVDEAEKADPSIHQAFLSILDRGNLDLANNTSADFRNAVVFFTSNVGNQLVEQLRTIAQKEAAAQDIPEAFREAAGEALAGQEARETVSEAIKMIFPPEFRGRIKELVIFRNLDEDAISKIIDLKMQDLQSEFTVNGVPIKIELDDSAKTYLTKNGYNPSEGARALEKLIQTAIRDQLTLAHGGVGIANKTIYIEQDGQTGQLVFYFSENPDLPQQQKPPPAQPVQEFPAQAEAQASQQPVTPRPEPLKTPPPVQPERKPPLTVIGQTAQGEGIPQIPPSVKNNLVFRFKQYGLESYINLRNEFVQSGLIQQAADANVQPEIVNLAMQGLAFRMRQYGLDSYIQHRDDLSRAGLINTHVINNLGWVHEWAKGLLQFRLRQYGHDSFISFRNDLVKAGIGTVEEWNNLL